MSKDYLARFPGEVRRVKGSALLSGRTFECSHEIVACASLFPASLERCMRERNATLDIFEPLVERPAHIYEIPPPTLAFLTPEERAGGGEGIGGRVSVRYVETAARGTRMAQ